VDEEAKETPTGLSSHQRPRAPDLGLPSTIPPRANSGSTGSRRDFYSQGRWFDPSTAHCCCRVDNMLWAGSIGQEDRRRHKRSDKLGAERNEPAQDVPGRGIRCAVTVVERHGLKHHRPPLIAVPSNRTACRVSGLVTRTSLGVFARAHANERTRSASVTAAGIDVKSASPHSVRSSSTTSAPRPLASEVLTRSRTPAAATIFSASVGSPSAQAGR
jgi:hypothetical protein